MRNTFGFFRLSLASGITHLSTERGNHAKNKKNEMGGLLIAGLALAASLIVAPLGAYAADVPTPEFKETYTVESAERAVCRSLSGKYIVFNEDNNGDPGDYGTVLNVEDGTQKRIKMSLENSWDGYCCFSSDEKTLYAYDEDSLSVTAYDLSSNKSKTYKLGSSVIADGRASRFQLSEDGKSFLFLSGSRSIQFCKYNFEKDEIEEQFAIDDDNLGVEPSSEVIRDDYWLSSDGMYGYIVFDGSEDGKSCNKIVTYDLGTASIANIVSVELDTENSYGAVYPLGLCFSGIPITSDKGTVLNNGALLSKNGEMTNDAVCGLSEPDYPNEDDGICSVNSSGSLALIAQGNDTSSDEVAVYDCASGKQGEKVKPSSPVGAYGSLSNDGRYVLGIKTNSDNNDKMVLLDLNKNVASKTPLKSGDRLWFADDDTLVCSMGHAEKGIRVDVYKSNIARSPLKTASSGKAEESFLFSPVIVGAIVVALAVVVIVVVFVVRRKMASRVATDSGATPLGSAADSQINPSRQQGSLRFSGEQQFHQATTSMDGPRFCASCGTPLVPDAKFCPHCGTPIKR